ncbi:MAG: exodeoxyribonuclease VII large subunit [Lachnospiraceae bacterium]|nr:exodeoxyribonuclease VII large subunit [Lachnospiraceae bacterium]
MKKPSVYTVTQINRYINGLFTEDFLLSDVTIKGEVSNVTYHTSGHIYFTLKDDGGMISAVMFAGKRSGLKFKMENGDAVTVRGSISVYEKSGKYQIYASVIERQGQGDLYLRFEELKKELSEMGMFDDMYKKPIPKFIKKLGIATAPTGAAVRDMIRISKQRNPYIEIILCPTQVQGEGSAESIAQSIERLDALNLDAIIIGRGGGSYEDLFSFNERIVAEAIFNCNTPVVSAVGHETDTVISDFVADLRASTPSHAAELTVCDMEEIIDDLYETRAQLSNIMLRRLSFERQKLSGLERTVRSYSPEARLRENKELLKHRRKTVMDLMQKKISDERSRLGIRTETLDGLSPLKRIASGYAYATDEKGRSLRSVSQVKKEQEITLAVSDGYIKGRVTDVIKEDING